MRRRAYLLGVLLAAGFAGGCVERKYTVYTDPPNVHVQVNNVPLGPSPADGSWVYYGKYHFTLMAPGYETLHVEENIAAPWYELWPLDFFFETLWPFEIQDVRTFHYQMVQLPIPNTEDLLRRSGVVRDQGRALRPAPTPETAGAAPETAGAAPTEGAPPTEMPRERDK
ncbi:MAG TPA: PEGA domain-containing protein [Gemmataceae bacterium]|nr:PEGA domain-containing protein [Gemmataceae bacterium]